MNVRGVWSDVLAFLALAYRRENGRAARVAMAVVAARLGADIAPVQIIRSATGTAHPNGLGTREAERFAAVVLGALAGSGDAHACVERNRRGVSRITVSGLTRRTDPLLHLVGRWSDDQSSFTYEQLVVHPRLIHRPAASQSRDRRKR